jgi:hypothetical protein
VGRSSRPHFLDSNNATGVRRAQPAARVVPRFCMEHSPRLGEAMAIVSLDGLILLTPSSG